MSLLSLAWLDTTQVYSLVWAINQVTDHSNLLVISQWASKGPALNKFNNTPGHAYTEQSHNERLGRCHLSILSAINTHYIHAP